MRQRGGSHHGPGAPLPFPRSYRVNQVLRRLLAEEIERLADADDRLVMLTVTAVETAPDLRQATVYLGSLTDEAAAALEERRVYLQRHIGRHVHMKRTPHLHFSADPALEIGERVEAILRRLHQPGEAEVDEDR